ncbi:MAG: 2-C-methyl-D-erythritol 4-phosphate cytidylyltransferase [Bacteroidales bacterium]|nr:2-C-methyl-D-erythritol 4-phosphate cytidylyltransferase [Bacteroidales bacterium]
MKVIIPMAGTGKRMRPHTLNTPKPLLKIAGKTIVERIVTDLEKSSGKTIKEIHFIIGDFGIEVEEKLLKIAKKNGYKGYIHYQEKALGTAHAVYCANEALNGECFVVFADTLYKGNFKIEDKDEAIIWTMIVKNPENYGVVVTDKNDIIKDIYEKPKKFVSDKAVIGIYYFKEGEKIKYDIENMIKNNKKTGAEFQLTDNIKSLIEQGLKIKCKILDDWLDCGNKEEYLKSTEKVMKAGKFENNKKKLGGVKIIEPVYIGRNVKVKHCKLGPYVSIEDDAIIENSVIKKSIIGDRAVIIDSKISCSIIGSDTRIKGAKGNFNLGDFSEYEKQ